MSRKLMGRYAIITNMNYSPSIRGKIGKIVEYDADFDFYGMYIDSYNTILYMSRKEIKIINNITLKQLSTVINDILPNTHKR